MTLNQFMTAVPWETMTITKAGYIRQRRTRCCPILAAANAKDGGKRRANDKTTEPAGVLGLDEPVEIAIIAAADNSNLPEYRRLRQRFERQMLRAIEKRSVA